MVDVYKNPPLTAATNSEAFELIATLVQLALGSESCCHIEPELVDMYTYPLEVPASNRVPSPLMATHDHVFTTEPPLATHVDPEFVDIYRKSFEADANTTEPLVEAAMPVHTRVEAGVSGDTVTPEGEQGHEECQNDTLPTNVTVHVVCGPIHTFRPNVCIVTVSLLVTCNTAPLGSELTEGLRQLAEMLVRAEGE